MKKKNILIIIGICLIIVGILLLLLLRNKELKPYVIEKGIKVLPADEVYSVTAEPYFKDENKNVIDIEGITVKESKVTYKFYDYSVTEPDNDGYVIHSFKVEVKTPVEYIEEADRTYPYHTYTYLFTQPSIFDYYTGTIFSEKHISTNNTVNYYDLDKVDDDMSYTKVTWKDKTYKIGVKVETSMKWDGIKKTDNGNGTRTVNDLATTSITIYIKTPKEYDGMMTFFNKKRTTKQDLLDQLEYNKKYNDLVKEANETGKKSDELIEMEERNNKHFKLLESKVKGEPDYKNDAFYVIRVTDIKSK